MLGTMRFGFVHGSISSLQASHGVKRLVGCLHAIAVNLLEKEISVQSPVLFSNRALPL